ncbi:hypothetical protein BGZ96_006898 [Linnemannia gamsii]|uniref:Transmembrane protein n=1 Tax=Linnemannia gamsii TaxID=64522 RepID=A0ABQ7KF80_9FUNG|nr:hypothetical protein BGZ96_006898 [Linnemannia gamsii]
MTLEYEDVARQAYLLLTPDLLTIFMITFLFIYPSSLCCGSSESRGSGQEVVAVEEEEEYYDYDNEEEEVGGVEGGAAASPVSATSLTGAAAGQPSASIAGAGAGAGKATTRSQAQLQLQVAPSISFSPATYHNNDSLQQQQQRRHQNLDPSNDNNVRRYQQQLLHSSNQDHDRITTASTFDTAATTLSPPSLRPSPLAKGDRLKSTEVSEKQHQDAQEESTGATGGSPPPEPVGVSLAEMIAQEERDETNRKRKRARLYTLARVTFSLGLTILALYWPAGQFKAPMGKQNVPTFEDHQPSNGNNGLPYNPSPYPRPSPQPSRVTSMFTSAPTPTQTPTGTVISGPTPTPTPIFSNNRMETNFTRSANGSTMAYYIGSRHNRKGRQKEELWCAEEESYGDDESAAVYCRAKVIRPVVTYVWSVFLIVELCIAAMAGDFSKHGIRRRRQSFGDEGMEEYYRQPRENSLEVVEEDAEKYVGREVGEQHGQSVQSLAIPDPNGAAAGTGAYTEQSRRPGSRIVQ